MAVGSQPVLVKTESIPERERKGGEREGGGGGGDGEREGGEGWREMGEGRDGEEENGCTCLELL